MSSLVEFSSDINDDLLNEHLACSPLDEEDQDHYDGEDEEEDEVEPRE